MGNYKIREANQNDYSIIMKLYKQASLFLKEKGVNQWQKNYPNDTTFNDDLSNNALYVLLDDCKIIGVASILAQEDPNYRDIEEGKWKTDGNYVVIHRITIDNNYKGQNLAGLFIDKAMEIGKNSNCQSIRIDTHKDNLTMQRFLERQQFSLCGIITLETKDKRLAFEKIMED